MLRQRHLIVGTAGHIDHGKSALVHALTGTDPDRLKEEKARGITIDLGFADLDLGAGRALSFVDVPGHERFVRHMVAGAAGIDAVLLVVAADDGVCLQTREHLEICKLLGIGHGVLALTKSDLADRDLREVVALEVRDLVAGSFLQEAPMVFVSSRSGEGLDALRAAIVGMFERVPERPQTGIPRLPVDRSFVLRGFGTVVTGTLVSGCLRTGDAVEVLPGGRGGRIRGLQVHHARVEESRAGQRTAVNLQGLERVEVPRGSTLTHPRSLLTTRRVWAEVTLLPSAPRPLRKGGRVRFHQGTCERGAGLRVLREGDAGSVIAEIVLGEETVLLPGDRFILRRPAPVDTVGGGVILDVRPPRGRAQAAAVTLGARQDHAGAITLRAARAGLGGRAPADLAAELGLGAPEMERHLEGMLADGRLVRAAGLLFDGSAWTELRKQVEAVLEAFHRDEPLRLGMPREELRGRAGREMPQEAWRAWLEGAATHGWVRLEGERVALPAHRVVLSEAERSLAQRVTARFRDAGLEPPELEEVLAGEAAGEAAGRIVELLVAAGDLVRIRDGRLFHREALETLRAKLKEYARTSRTIDVATFKQLAGVTRKNAIPLLEHLDAERTTRRVGNQREILRG
jgi:selenocysteine-specific elongation factor